MESILNKELEGFNDTLTGRDIVIVGIQPWHYELGSNCKNIALEFAKTNRVLYVNIPLSRKTYYSKNKTAGVERHTAIIKNKTETIFSIQENMWEFYPPTLIEPANSVHYPFIFKWLNKLNNKRFAKDIQAATKRLGFKDYILFNDNDIYTGYHLKEFLKPHLSIYYMRDFLQGSPYWQKNCQMLEPLLIAKSDLVVANSIYYADYCKKFNPLSYYKGQGCKLELFNDANGKIEPAKDLSSIPRPIIGYVGAVDSGRLDLTILEIIANHNPEWSVVLVGPQDEVFEKSNLHQLKNVHFIGRKEMHELPGFVKAFDVCMNPQLVNQLTIGNYPLKVDEYLAMGKPVVATRTDAMRIFENHTYLAQLPSEYPALIEKAILENTVENQQARIAFSQSHSWENSMKVLYKAIHEREKSQ